MIMDLRMNECPVSFITPESTRLVELIYENRSVKEATGAVLFGQDSGAWDSRYYDAVKVCASEDGKIDRERDKASKTSI